MKKGISLLLVMLMAFAMTACSNDTGNSSAVQNSSVAQDSSVAEESSAAEESVAEESSAAEESVAEESSATDAQVEVMSYEEYMAAELDSEVCVETYVQAKQSYYAEQQTATLYTQDEDGAYFVYDAAISQEDYDKLVPGTKIRVTGYKAEWSGEVEIMDGTVEVLDGEDTFVAEALDATDLLGTSLYPSRDWKLSRALMRPMAMQRFRSCTTIMVPVPKATTCTSMCPRMEKPTHSSSNPICATARRMYIRQCRILPSAM